MFACLPLVTGALNYVIQVRNNACRAKRLTMVVEVDTPGIARPLGENFERVPCWVITPDAGVNRHALRLWRARLAHIRVCEHTVTTVEPTIRAPGEGIQCLV